jgi:hypothetical protein
MSRCPKWVSSPKKAISTRRQINMMHHRLLLCVIFTAYFVAQSQALPPMLVDSNDLDWVGETPGDPLDPGFVGETMSMPLDPDLVREAKEAGIIRDTNPLYRSPSGSGAAYGSGATYLGISFASTEYDEPGMVDAPAQAVQDVNVTGPWSLDLIALDQVLKHMDLALVQNRDVVMGYGAVISRDETQRVTASGSTSGDRLSLTVMPIDGLYLYKLYLALDFHTAGTYTAYSADGSTLTGDITGTAPTSIIASTD